MIIHKTHHLIIVVQLSYKKAKVTVS